MPRERRACPQRRGGVQDVLHDLVGCPLHSLLRARFSDLVFGPSMHSFMAQDLALVATTVAKCRRTEHGDAAAAALEKGAAATRV